MRERIAKLFRSFKSRVLLGFFTFNRIFLLWIFIYFFINKKQTELGLFTNHLTQLQNNYAQSDRYLQNFILTGYHQPSFYTTGKQKDIDHFWAEQDTIKNGLQQIKEEAEDNHIKISDQLQALIGLHASLLDTVNLLKQLYAFKGFKDFGSEGSMRWYAHFLEDSCPIDKTDILMLRRREKDFMLREDTKYVDEFNAIADKQIAKFSSLPVTLNALVNYKKHFNEFADYAERLGINNDRGVYGHVQDIIDRLDKEYYAVNARVDKEVTKLNNTFKTVLIVTFVILLLAAIFFSITLSNGLTKDIKMLNKKVSAFVRSGFKDDEDAHEPLASKITEIQGLNSDFLALRQTLKTTLANLENSIKGEQKISADLEATIASLSRQIAGLEKQKQQMETAGITLNAFFHSSLAAHILIGKELEIIAFNKAGMSFIKEVFGKEITTDGNILDYIDAAYRDKFTDGFQQALSGKFITDKHTFNPSATRPVLFDISFLPVSDNEGNVFAVSFSTSKSG